MNKEAIAKYQKARQSLARSMARYRRMGYSVPELPKRTKQKNITEASVRRMEKAAKEWKYEVQRSAADFSIRQQRKATSRLDAEDRQKFLEIAKDRFGTLKLNQEQLSEIIEEIGIGDTGKKALDDLKDLIKKAEEVVTGEKYGKAGEKQRGYFDKVHEIAGQAIQRFEHSLDWNNPEKTAVIRKNLSREWDNISALMENFLWYDSDQGPDWSLLDLIQTILQSNPFGRMAKEEKRMQKEVKYYKDKENARLQAFYSTMAEKRELAKAVRKASKSAMSDNL